MDYEFIGSLTWLIITAKIGGGTFSSTIFFNFLKRRTKWIFPSHWLSLELRTKRKITHLTCNEITAWTKDLDLQSVYSTKDDSYYSPSDVLMCKTVPFINFQLLNVPFTLQRMLHFSANLCAWPCTHSITLLDIK